MCSPFTCYESAELKDFEFKYVIEMFSISRLLRNHAISWPATSCIDVPRSWHGTPIARSIVINSNAIHNALFVPFKKFNHLTLMVEPLCLTSQSTAPLFSVKRCFLAIFCTHKYSILCKWFVNLIKVIIRWFWIIMQEIILKNLQRKYIVIEISRNIKKFRERERKFPMSRNSPC